MRSPVVSRSGRHSVAVLVAALLALADRGARAGALETLVMPGAVSSAHAKIETECTKCHRAFEASAQPALCLDCHDDVAADRTARSGFHGRSSAAVSGDCRSCHPEHRGRDGPLVVLDRASFAHDATDAPLRGAHATVACGACHLDGKKWREAKTECADCHGKADPHEGKMGSKCADCHDERTWKSARFDHSRTKFSLEGKHERVACATCHPAERWAGTPKECVACHTVQDVHRGSMGSDCASCHDTSDWKKSRFDHDKTKFALTGKHRSASCESCHTGGSFETALATDCLSCHRTEDVHEGKHGPRCQSCHGTTAWKPASFDHDRKTEFPLRGAHEKAACEACHTAPPHEKKLDRSCISCHRKDDPHDGQQGESCERCHGEAAWKEKVSFDHDLARFPLLGLHATTPCEACHSSAVFRGTPRSCLECHGADDRHERRLGPVCESCHNANGWALWRFDHDVQTTFTLHGAHATTACETCHRQPVTDSLRLPKTCVACHSDDDSHRGSFGRRCEDCHVETSWGEVTIRP